jgi:hypothetical protein
MTLEATIITVAGGAFPTNRLFHIDADEEIDTGSAYGVFSIVGGEDPANNLSGHGNYATARIQFSIIAKRSTEIVAAAQALRTAMKAANDAGTLRNLPLGPGFDLPGDETSLRGRVVEYQITSFDPLA